MSVSTVSRVMNDTCPVREDKRKLVLSAAESLGYSPNPAALSLLNKKTGGVGVLLPFVSGEFFSELLGGLDESAQENGLILMVSSSHRKAGEFRKAIQMLDKRVDGLIVMAPELDVAGAASVLKRDVPTVFINTYAEGVDADVFNFDNLNGARLLTEHLLSEGHRRIAFIQGPPAAEDARLRRRGYRAAMREAGVPDTRSLEFKGGYTRDDGFKATQHILSSPDLPTAVLAANDYCAMGVISALHEVGISVPDQVSVTGFDGLDSTRYSVPTLTTVRVPVREIGRRAMHRIARLIRGEGREGEARSVMPVEVLIRESTAPPPITPPEPSFRFPTLASR